MVCPIIGAKEFCAAMLGVLRRRSQHMNNTHEDHARDRVAITAKIAPGHTLRFQVRWRARKSRFAPKARWKRCRASSRRVPNFSSVPEQCSRRRRRIVREMHLPREGACAQLRLRGAPLGWTSKPHYGKLSDRICALCLHALNRRCILSRTGNDGADFHTANHLSVP